MTATVAPSTLISEKLNELCAAIAADVQIQSSRDQAEAFLADESAVGLYRNLITLNRDLHNRQRQGQQISDEEVEQLQDLEEQANTNQAIINFQAAQDALQNIANMVNGFVAKTLEKGRVPTLEEVFPQDGGCCGGGCGCH
ncbi:MAG: YlbF family regulator [Marmoricola sp.]